MKVAVFILIAIDLEYGVARWLICEEIYYNARWWLARFDDECGKAKQVALSVSQGASRAKFGVFQVRRRALSSETALDLAEDCPEELCLSQV